MTAAGRYEADVDADANWSIVLVLNEGGNLATFVATDQAGNTTTAKVAITYTPPPQADGTVLIANQDGIYQVDPQGNATVLVQGRVASAVDDTRGGLLFQIDGGRNWDAVFGEEQGVGWSTVIWWVPPGMAVPQQLLVPTPGSGHDLSLHDAYRTDNRFGVVYTRHEGTVPYGTAADMHDRLRGYDVSTRAVNELYVVRGYEWSLGEVSAGGGLVTFTEHQMFGLGCILVGDSGETVTRPGVPTSPACFGSEDDVVDCPHSCSLCDDGSRVAYIDAPAAAAPHQMTLVVREIATGKELARVAIPANQEARPYALSLEGSFLLVNLRYSGGSTALDGFQEALLFNLDTADASPQELPIAGWARLVKTPVDIDAPITLPNQ